MVVALVGEPGEHPGSVGVNAGARGDDIASEVDYVQSSGAVGQLQAYPAEAARSSRSTAIVIGALSLEAPRLPPLLPPRKL